jgi:diaminopimelate epimerase
MRFAKYHGAGNDFVMLEDLEGRLGPPGSLDPVLVRELCDRHTGVGGDGVIRVLGPQDVGAFRMDYYNADGGVAEMCGNGIRCLVAMQRAAGRLPPGPQRIITAAGPVEVHPLDDGRIRVDMGEPRLGRPNVPMTGEGSSERVAVELDDGITVEGTGVSMGNPHFVLFADDLGRPLDDDLVLGLGPRLEVHAAFPARANIGFVEVVAPDEIRLRVWERGVGETLACGSGTCAAVAAAATLGRTQRRVAVTALGGELLVDWATDGHIWLTGPAERVFDGEIDAAWLRSRGLDALVAVVAP